MPSELSDIRKRAIAGIQAGHRFEVSRTFTLDETLEFGELTRDYNPVHYLPAFAENKGFSGPILHGLLTGSMLCEIGGQIGWLATGMDFAFKGPVYDGDTLTCTVTVTEVHDDGLRAKATVECTNQRGEVVVEARLRGHLPSAEQRALMAADALTNDEP